MCMFGRLWSPSYCANVSLSAFELLAFTFGALEAAYSEPGVLGPEAMMRGFGGAGEGLRVLARELFGFC